MLDKLMRKKPIGHHHNYELLRPSLNATDLTLMGIGAIIGAGVFVLTGVAAATKAGPAIVLSYVIAGFAAMFAALAYAELTSSVGGTGSAYSYAYAGFGEFIAWLIGWNLLLEYTMSVATVAIGWSDYVNDLFVALGYPLPNALTHNPFQGGVVNLMAVFIIIALSILLCFGVKQSARFNAAMVFIKLITIAVFVIVAVPHINHVYWREFLPFGYSGVMQGAALVFFAYIGFDALSTAVEEAHHPTRDIPIGIILSLIICTLVYILVSALLTLIVSYKTLDVGSPVAEAMLLLGHNIAAGLIAAGAIAGLTTVMLVMYYGLTRISLAITRDGLLPTYFSTLHSTTHTPVKLILSSGILIALIAGLSPIDRAAELVNIGTLTAFAFVCIGVMVLRVTHRDLHRPFKLPMNPVIPLLGVIFCIFLMLSLPKVTWYRFVIWTFVGVILYFLYGIRKSALSKKV